MACAAGCRDNAREYAPRQQDFAMVPPHSQEEMPEHVLGPMGACGPPMVSGWRDWY